MLLEFNMIQFLKNRLEGIPLRLQLWDGRKIDLASHPKVTLTLVKPTALRHLFYPTLNALGTAYVEEEILVDGSIQEILSVLNAIATTTTQGPRSILNRTIGPAVCRALGRFEAILYSFRSETKTLPSDETPSDFYKLWLDRHRVFSSGYFKTGTEDIDTAQEQKLEYISRKLMLSPGDRLLDIGCSWGALLRWAVQNHEVKATGITINRNQYDYITDFIKREKLEKRCKVILCDYQDLNDRLDKESFDKIVSIGMFDTLKQKHLPKFYCTVNRLLKKGGLFLHQGISTGDHAPLHLDASGAGRFINRYIFTDGESHEFTANEREILDHDFEIADIENLRPHQVKTLLHWLTRLDQHQQEARTLAGDRHYRIWKAYLIGSTLAFERGWMTVHQTLSFKKTESGTWPLPWTREHLYLPSARGEKTEVAA